MNSLGVEYRPGGVCPEISTEDGNFLLVKPGSTEDNIEAVEKYVKAVINKLGEGLQQQYQQTETEPDLNTKPLVFRNITSNLPQIKPSQLSSLSSFAVTYDPVEHIKAENKAEKMDQADASIQKPTLELKGDKEFIKNFFSDQTSKIANLHKIFESIKNKSEVLEQLKNIYDEWQNIKKQTKEQNWQKGNSDKANLKDQLKQKILDLEILINTKYSNDNSLRTTIEALKSAADKTSKPSRFMEQVNAVIIGGQLTINYDEAQNSIIFKKTDGTSVMEVKGNGEDSLKIVSGIERPTNETVTQMVLQAKKLLKKINDETKTFRVINCEDNPEAALRIYLFGKAAGLNPIISNTETNQTEQAVQKFLSMSEEHSSNDKKLIEIYNKYSETTGILKDDLKKALLTELKDWEQNAIREYTIKGSVFRKNS
jgi:hypothetical protein